MGTFYRIGFYGDQFEQLNGKEFVYKEKPFTRLAEVRSKIQESFLNLKVVVVLDTNPIDIRTLEKGENKIQITSLEPFSPLEGESRPEYQSFETLSKIFHIHSTRVLIILRRPILLQHSIYEGGKESWKYRRTIQEDHGLDS
jgi:hypothetical protein